MDKQGKKKTKLSHKIIPLSKNQAGSELLYLYGTDVKFDTYVESLHFGRNKSANGS